LEKKLTKIYCGDKLLTAEYLHQIFKKYQKGDATEISYYSTLEKFVKEFSESKRKKKIEITTIGIR
jgi:hypothetical protein